MYFHAAVNEQSTKPDSTTKTRSSAQHSKHNQLLQSCTANVGMFESVLLQQQSSLSQNKLSSQTELPAADTQRSAAAGQLLVRYHWLGACVSEHLKHFQDAAQQYEACKAALETVNPAADQAMYLRPVVPAGAPSISTELVDKHLEALKLVAVVENGRKCLDEGGHTQLTSCLVPILLADDTSKILLDVPQQLVGLELLQVCHVVLVLQHARNVCVKLHGCKNGSLFAQATSGSGLLYMFDKLLLQVCDSLRSQQLMLSSYSSLMCILCPTQMVSQKSASSWLLRRKHQEGQTPGSCTCSASLQKQLCSYRHTT